MPPAGEADGCHGLIDGLRSPTRTALPCPVRTAPSQLRRPAPKDISSETRREISAVAAHGSRAVFRHLAGCGCAAPARDPSDAETRHCGVDKRPLSVMMMGRGFTPSRRVTKEMVEAGEHDGRRHRKGGLGRTIARRRGAGCRRCARDVDPTALNTAARIAKGEGYAWWPRDRRVEIESVASVAETASGLGRRTCSFTRRGLFFPPSGAGVPGGHLRVDLLGTA